MIFGQAGDDTITLTSSTSASTIFGGQGDDHISTAAANSANYVSGDIGNDTILGGAGFETLLGGQGDDSIIGGQGAGVGSIQYLFGNSGNDHVGYIGAGSVQIYGGQGDDVITVGSASSGRNYLSGDAGNDSISSSQAGSDTIHGGQGADVITLVTHASANGDSIVVGAGESTSAAATDETNVQHLTGFLSGSDHVLLAGHAALAVGSGGNLTTYADASTRSSEAAAFQAAYTYAFGDGGSNTAHIGGTEYLAVQESYGGTTSTYLFTSDHHAIVLIGEQAASLKSGDVLAG